MKKILMLLLLVTASAAGHLSYGQIFEASADWEENEKTIALLKWSQLYYEANVGWNIKKGYTNQADFIYFGLGIGFPTLENAWRKFLPAQKLPSNEQEAEMFGSMSTKDVYGGKIGIGWMHFFNHSVGIYTQANWGFLADFGSPDESTSTTTDSSSKKTFIYNTVPIEAGVCFNLWKHLHIQGGVTYMFKEIPLLTLGIGATF